MSGNLCDGRTGVHPEAVKRNNKITGQVSRKKRANWYQKATRGINCDYFVGDGRWCILYIQVFRKATSMNITGLKHVFGHFHPHRREDAILRGGDLLHNSLFWAIVGICVFAAMVILYLMLTGSTMGIRLDNIPQYRYFPFGL